MCNQIISRTQFTLKMYTGRNLLSAKFDTACATRENAYDQLYWDFDIIYYLNLLCFDLWI